MELKEFTNNNNILNIYMYGSRVYGTHTEKSDYDFIMVVKNKDVFINNTEHDIQIYSQEEFKNKIAEHEISVLECLFLPEDKILKNTEIFEFNLDLATLRNSISSKASNSWVKAKKKFIVEKDFNPYIGLKSAWHAFRMLDFGIQIAKYKEITNYASMNELYNEIMICKTWDEVEEKYKQKYNEKSSEFRMYAPKNTVKPK